MQFTYFKSVFQLLSIQPGAISLSHVMNPRYLGHRIITAMNGNKILKQNTIYDDIIQNVNWISFDKQYNI